MAFTVTPSDTANLTSPAQMLYVGSAGNLNVALTGQDQGYVLMKNIPAGTFFEASVLAVANTDTTASNIVAFL